MIKPNSKKNVGVEESEYSNSCLLSAQTVLVWEGRLLSSKCVRAVPSVMVTAVLRFT